MAYGDCICIPSTYNIIYLAVRGPFSYSYFNTWSRVADRLQMWLESSHQSRHIHVNLDWIVTPEIRKIHFNIARELAFVICKECCTISLLVKHCFMLLSAAPPWARPKDLFPHTEALSVGSVYESLPWMNESGIRGRSEHVQ